MSNIDSKLLVQSTKWSAVAEVAVRLASPIANIILARLLAPEVFGLISTFVLVITFADIFVDGGFQKHLIQCEFSNEREKDECTNVAFWTNLVLSFFIWFLIIVLRNPLAELVGSPGHGKEMAVICMIIPVTSFSSIQFALYKREFKFKQLLPIRLSTSMVPLLITVPFAFFIRNGWALIIGNIIKEVLNAVLLTVLSDWKPRFYYSFKQLKSMITNCLWLLADALMVWVTSYSGTLIVSHSLDATHLGYYRVGSSTIMAYLNLMFLITQPIVYSALSRVQYNKKEADYIYAQYLKYVAYFIIPLGVGVFVFRGFVTRILLGPAWTEVTTIIGVTGLTYPIFMLVGQFNSNYFRAMGKPKVAMVVQSLYAGFLVLGLMFFVKQSFLVFSIASSSICIVYSCISAIALITLFNYPVKLMIAGWGPSVLAASVMGAFAMICHYYLSNGFAFDVVLIVLSILVYYLCLVIIPSSKKDVKLMKTMLGRNRNK